MCRQQVPELQELRQLLRVYLVDVQAAPKGACFAL